MKTRLSIGILTAAVLALGTPSFAHSKTLLTACKKKGKFVKGMNNVRCTLRRGYIMAAASNMAYSVNSRSSAKKYLGKLNLTPCGGKGFYETKGSTNAQFILGYDDYNVVLAWRGSELAFTEASYRDWKDDLSADLYSVVNWYGSGVKLHRGFYTSFKAAKDKHTLYTLVKECAHKGGKNRNVWVTGHSLGGALAKVSAYYLSNKSKKSKKKNRIKVKRIDTFGAPDVGNKGWKKAYQKQLGSKTKQWVNSGDLVAVATRSLPGYKRVGKSHRIECKQHMGLEGKCAVRWSTKKLYAQSITDHFLDKKYIPRLWKLLSYEGRPATTDLPRPNALK